MTQPETTYSLLPSEKQARELAKVLRAYRITPEKAERLNEAQWMLWMLAARLAKCYPPISQAIKDRVVAILRAMQEDKP